MAKTKKATTKCPKIEPKQLHAELGKVLLMEQRDGYLYARNSEQQHHRDLPPLQLLALLP